MPPATGFPLHNIHHRDAESLYVLDGELVCRLGTDTLVCSAGDTLMLRKGIPHAWRVSGDSAQAWPTARDHR